MVENFEYESLKSKLPPSGTEGGFAYEHPSSRVINEVQEGAFNYEHQKSSVEENLKGWFVTPWFFDWFGEEIFGFERLGLEELTPAAESSFEFENLKPTISPVTLNDDFRYKRF